jgi:hypothetical protein
LVRKFRFSHRIVFGVNFIIVSRSEISSRQLSIVKNSIVQIAIFESRIREIRSNKRNLFHRAGIEFGFWHFLVRKRRIIQKAILKTYAKHKIGTGIKLDSHQFTGFEMNRFQTRSVQLHHRQIAIDKFAIHKCVVAKITIREIAVLENAIFKLPIVDFFVRERNFFERFMCVYEVFH